MILIFIILPFSIPFLFTCLGRFLHVLFFFLGFSLFFFFPGGEANRGDMESECRSFFFVHESSLFFYPQEMSIANYCKIVDVVLHYDDVFQAKEEGDKGFNFFVTVPRPRNSCTWFLLFLNEEATADF